MDYHITKEAYKQIEDMIASDESVVGIDAKETHIIIIHMLKELKDRLDILESKIENLK